MVGELAFAPKELQYSIFCTAKPLFEVAGSRKIVILAPLPRYLESGCCDNAEHISNRKDEGFRRDLESAVVECRKNLKDFCFRQGIRNARIAGPWSAVKEIGDNVWLDPVHLSAAGYAAIAALLLKLSSELDSKPEPFVSPDFKRPRDGDSGHSGAGGRQRHQWTAGGRGGRSRY